MKATQHALAREDKIRRVWAWYRAWWRKWTV